jgi:cell division protein FtsI (penicillin-binding protein 3)
MATRSTTKASGATSAAAPARVRLARWRINAALLVCLLLIGQMVLRLGELQIVRHRELRERAYNEIERQFTLLPTRGMITDRHGNVLAMDVDRQSLWVIPAQIDSDEAPKLALTLAALVGKDPDEILAALTDRDHYWLPVARWLEPKVAEQIEALDAAGLRLEYEPRRVYPQGSFGAQVIGAVNYNGEGIGGLEGFYNDALTGVSGSSEGQFDRAQNPIAIAPLRTVPPRDGVHIRTTLDPLIQNVVERELKIAVEDHNADGGSIIVMDPRSGAIRGMASWPPFDPNRYDAYPEKVYSSNPAVTDVYEPGSTFKMITVAAGLQARAFTADTLVNDTGSIWRYDQPLRNWNGGANGMIDSAKVLYYSSNVGAMLLNELTGPERFYEILDDFGFGRATTVGLGGESGGIVNSWGGQSYNDLNFLTNAYGQGISVTPLQMVQAAGAIANDGVMMKPYIVEEVCEADHSGCTTTEPVVAGRPIEPGVAWTVRRMLVHSANHYAPVVWAPINGNYGDQWLVPGYQVGAKTGTSSIPLEGGGYDPSYTIGSVLGFGPADTAHYVVLVKIDRPKDDIWGVSTAIPVFQKVMSELLRYERIPPDPGLVSPGQEIGR